jgi:hypothetical protein
MRAPLSGWLAVAVLRAQRHQPGHLGLGDGDLLAAPVGERNIGNLAVSELGHLSQSVACFAGEKAAARAGGARPVMYQGPPGPARGEGGDRPPKKSAVFHSLLS